MQVELVGTGGKAVRDLSDRFMNRSRQSVACVPNTAGRISSISKAWKGLEDLKQMRGDVVASLYAFYTRLRCIATNYGSLVGNPPGLRIVVIDESDAVTTATMDDRRRFQHELNVQLGLIPISGNTYLSPPALVIHVTATDKPIMLKIIKDNSPNYTLAAEDIFDIPLSSDYVGLDM